MRPTSGDGHSFRDSWEEVEVGSNTRQVPLFTRLERAQARNELFQLYVQHDDTEVRTLIRQNGLSCFDLFHKAHPVLCGVLWWPSVLVVAFGFLYVGYRCLAFAWHLLF